MLRPGLERLIAYLNDTHERMAAGFLPAFSSAL